MTASAYNSSPVGAENSNSRWSVITRPGDLAPDLSTAGALLRYSRLRDVGIEPDSAIVMADAGYDVIAFAEVQG